MQDSVAIGMWNDMQMKFVGKPDRYIKLDIGHVVYDNIYGTTYMVMPNAHGTKYAPSKVCDGYNTLCDRCYFSNMCSEPRGVSSDKVFVNLDTIKTTSNNNYTSYNDYDNDRSSDTCCT